MYTPSPVSPRHPPDGAAEQHFSHTDLGLC